MDSGTQVISGTACRICGAAAVSIGKKFGRYRGKYYDIRRCDACRFTFVENPDRDYAALYDEKYYSGRGADPMVTYVREFDHPGDTIRIYEWAGILEVVRSLKLLSSGGRWLDFGCGNGGLVRYLLQHGIREAIGFEEGWIRRLVEQSSTPLLSRHELEHMTAEFDVVTAIEVLEHVEKPLEVLATIRRLLKPGGLFFFTTGNAAPYRADLLRWPYLIPEIHISLFEPEAVARALAMTGFRPEFLHFPPGFSQIIRFKVLKNLGVRRRNCLERVMPWALISRLVDRRFQITAHPVGWAVCETVRNST